MCRLKTSITKSGVIKSNCIADKNALTMDPECKHSSAGRCVLNRVVMPKPPTLKRKSSKKKSKSKKAPIYVALPAYNNREITYVLPAQPVHRATEQLRQIRMVPYRSSEVSDARDIRNTRDIRRYSTVKPANRLPSYYDLMALTPKIRY
jgi:hypothetical protein